MNANLLLHGVIVGLVGVAAFDLWHTLLQRMFSIRAPNWAVMGRWLLSPSSIGKPPAAPFTLAERALGASAHFVTGIVFGVCLVLIAGSEWVDHPTVLLAVAFGVVTTVFAWLLIMPALGHGIAASKTPVARKVRLVSLSAHAVMGVGFYLGALFSGGVL
jgi:hypothetical protein